MELAGLGTPYWYEWEVGLLSCLDMLYDDNIESVVLQSSLFKSLDDVVINYTNKSSLNIQVKHTDIDKNFTLSTLISGTEPMIKAWASDWEKARHQFDIQEIRIVTNRRWGTRRDNRLHVCSFNHFVNVVLPKWKCDYEYTEPEDNSAKETIYNEYSYEKNAVERIKEVLVPILGTETEKFIGLLTFKKQPDLGDLEKNLQAKLEIVLGTTREEPINAAKNSLLAQLRIWATSERKSEKITREDVYQTICVEKPFPVLPKYDLYPEKPVFSSRIKFAEHFVKIIKESKQRFLFLEGLPGCGKTNFVSYLAQQRESIVDFRFYTYLPPDSNSPYFSDDVGNYGSDLLWGSILTQLRKKFSELNLLYDVRFPLDYSYMSIAEMRSVALKYLPIYARHIGRKIFLFIDGLDHAARCKNFQMTFLQQLPEPNEIDENIKFVLVGQPVYDKYPRWLQKTNPDILFIGMPLLECQDVLQILSDRNISIPSLDIKTLSEDIISVVGNNTLNVIFAIKEIENISFDFVLPAKNCISSISNKSICSYFLLKLSMYPFFKLDMYSLTKSLAD